MRILITNDDGIAARGLLSLKKIASKLSDDIWTVAPEYEQSGASRSITIAEPIRMRKYDEHTFSVRGTPADCVLMAAKKIMPSPPDLILSGVNRGQNIADDVTYSGTIAAAMEGTALGIRSIALSQTCDYSGREPATWETAELYGSKIIQKLIATTSCKTILFNINFPNVLPSKVKGIEITKQGRRDQNMMFVEERSDVRGIPYYWIGFEENLNRIKEGTDIKAIADGKISVTPLHMNLTHVEEFAQVDGNIDFSDIDI